MGYYVFTSIIFPINQDGERPYDVKGIAARHYARLSKLDSNNLHVAEEEVSLHFLSALMQGKCIQCSTKGEGCAYAVTGNYTKLEGLVTDLLPFFDDLWATDEAIFNFEHVIMMTQPEQQSKVFFAEIVSEKHSKSGECEYRRDDACMGLGDSKRVRFYDHEHMWHWHQM